MIFSGSVTERNFGIKAAIYGLLRLVSKTCKVSSTMKSYESAKGKCYDKRILSIKRTASLETSLLNICLGCLASSSHDIGLERGKLVTLVKGNVHYVNFFQNPYSTSKDFD